MYSQLHTNGNLANPEGDKVANNKKWPNKAHLWTVFHDINDRPSIYDILDVVPFMTKSCRWMQNYYHSSYAQTNHPFHIPMKKAWEPQQQKHTHTHNNMMNVVLVLDSSKGVVIGWRIHSILSTTTNWMRQFLIQFHGHHCDVCEVRSVHNRVA